MIQCADSTMLRANLDHVDPALDAHLDDCDACSGLLRSVAEDAGYARAALDLLDEPGERPVDVEAALAAVLGQVARPVPLAVPSAVPQRRGHRLLLAAAGLVVVALCAVTPAGRSAVAATLDAFRGERLQAVTVDLGDLARSPLGDGLRGLEAFGDLDLAGLEQPALVADVAAGARHAGIDAPELAEPADRILALAPGTVALELADGPGVDVPSELEGATLTLDVPGAIAALYAGDGDGPQVVIGRSGPLGVRADGAPLEDIRAFLLDRPELPEDLRRQLAGIEDWRSTIPIPVPLEGPAWRDVTVAGRPAIAFGDDSGAGAGVIRQDADGITVVGGRIPVSRALELAEGA